MDVRLSYPDHRFRDQGFHVPHQHLFHPFVVIDNSTPVSKPLSQSPQLLPRPTRGSYPRASYRANSTSVPVGDSLSAHPYPAPLTGRLPIYHLIASTDELLLRHRQRRLPHHHYVLLYRPPIRPLPPATSSSEVTVELLVLQFRRSSSLNLLLL